MAKWDNINAQTISEMSMKEIKRTYSELRSVARKRADRLEAAGYEAQRFDPVANVDPDDLEEELKRVAYYLRSPGSSIKTARKEKEQITMAARGYNIRDFNKFGNFMDAVRYRFRGRVLDDSDPYVQIYDAAEKRQMSQKTLQREFGKYLNYADTALILRDALKEAESKSDKRLTAKNLKGMLERRNIDAVYKRNASAERDRRTAERTAPKRKSRKKGPSKV